MHDIGCHKAAELVERLEALRLQGEEVVGRWRGKGLHEHACAGASCGETGQCEAMGLALAVTDAESSLQFARLRRAVTGSELERMTGIWTPEVPGLPDPLLLPSATFVVQETAP